MWHAPHSQQGGELSLESENFDYGNVINNVGDDKAKDDLPYRCSACNACPCVGNNISFGFSKIQKKIIPPIAYMKYFI